MEDGSIPLISAFLPEIYLSSVLLVLSGFFSSSETAFFSLSRESRKALRSQRSLFSKAISSLLKRPKSALITLLFGNMVVNVAFFCIAYGVTREIAASNIHNRALIAGAVSIVSLLIIIVAGEVIPKNVAIRIPLLLAKIYAVPILVLSKLFYPFCLPLYFISDKIALFFSKEGKDEKNITVDELKMIVKMGEKQGLVDESEHSMINAVLDFQEKQVKEVMAPRVDMAIYNVAESVKGFLGLVRATKHTKIPVYSDNPDTIIGLVHAKDIFLNQDAPLRNFVKPIQFIPETKTVESLLRKFRNEHRQMAIVIDEYGGTAGLVTLEDILEEIVGEIQDEHDGREEEMISKIEDNMYYLAGNLGIREWSDFFEVELDSHDFDTIGGFILSLLGNIPKRGNVVQYENMKFTVDRLRKRRIVKVIMEIERT